MNYTVADGAKLLGAKMKRFIEFDALRGGPAVDDERRSFALFASPLYRPAAGVLLHR